MNLPPGDTGLPLLGETLAFLKNGFDFVESRARKHGPIFRTRILGRDTAVIVGPDACTTWIDPTLVQRDGSQPGFFFEILAGPSLPHLDDDAHRNRKKRILAGFTREALAAYVPALAALVERSAARWAAAGEMAWMPELKRLAIEGICANVMGIESPDDIVREYDTIIKGTAGLPINLPWTAFGRCLKARDRMLDRFAASIREHQSAPRPDGMSRMLAEGIDPDALKRELHHIIIAGYIIYAEFAWAALELARRPELRRDLEAEVSGGELTIEGLDRMPLLTQTVMEVKRLCPILPVIFGKARREFEFKGRTVPAGWAVFWGLRSTHLDPNVYAGPETFDPSRFSPSRAEHMKHAHAFVPQGPGPDEGHKCPGTDYATYFMKTFIAVLLRGGTTWEVPEQDLSYRWGQIPPEPRSGLRVSVVNRG